MLSPCPTSRGEVTSPTGPSGHDASLGPSSSSLQAAPVSQSSHPARAWLWFQVARAEGFKWWQMMEMGKAGRNRADSFTDVWCCISWWPMPGFSGKGLYYGSTIPGFPQGLCVVFLIYWILHSSFTVKIHELYCKGLEIRYSHEFPQNITPGSGWFTPGFVLQMPSLTLKFTLQWRCCVSESLSFPWAVLQDPVQHPVESGGKKSWETGKCVARKKEPWPKEGGCQTAWTFTEPKSRAVHVS